MRKLRLTKRRRGDHKQRMRKGRWVTIGMEEGNLAISKRDRAQKRKHIGIHVSDISSWRGCVLKVARDDDMEAGEMKTAV